MGGRWDHDDPADEHDINELRRAMQDGTEPQLIGKPGKVKGGCSVVAFLALAVPIVAVVAAIKGWG